VPRPYTEASEQSGTVPGRLHGGPTIDPECSTSKEAPWLDAFMLKEKIKQIIRSESVPFEDMVWTIALGFAMQETSGSANKPAVTDLHEMLEM